MGLNINSQMFYYVLEVKRCGSISRASQNLFISQPNLSTYIKSLELTLGFPVFERSSKGIVPTQEGALFIHSAEIIVSELENIQKIPLLCMNSSDSGLSIVCVYAPYILELFVQFIRSSNIQSKNHTFKETGLNHALQDMIAKTYRLGFFYDFEVNHDKRIVLAEKYGLDIRLLIKHIPVMAFVKNGHPLSANKSIHISELRPYPLVTYEDFAHEDWLGAIGIEKSNHNILFIYDRGGMKESIQRNNFVGISVGDVLDQNQDILQIPLAGISSSLNQYYIKSKDYRLNLTESNLIQFIIDSMKES